MNSMPARSAIWHMATISSQFAGQRSGARLMVSPPSQLALNTPSLKRLGPCIGLVWRGSLIFGPPWPSAPSVELQFIDAIEVRHLIDPLAARHRVEEPMPAVPDAGGAVKIDHQLGHFESGRERVHDRHIVDARDAIDGQQ